MLKSQPRGMTLIPYVEEPPSPTTDTPPSTTGTPKSRSRFLSNWRKPSSTSLWSNAYAGDKHAQQVTLPKGSRLPPPLNPKDRSKMSHIATLLDSSKQPRSPKREETVTDLSPVAQVHGQALIPASLDTPASSSGTLRSVATFQTFPLGKDDLASPNGSNTTTIAQIVPRKDELLRQSSGKKEVSRKPSDAERAGGAPKSNYSLFPVQHTLKSKDKPTASLATLMPPVSLLENLDSTTQKTGERSKQNLERGRTVTSELREHHVSMLPTMEESEPLQRSPRVTEEMITSNFGIARNDRRASPTPDTKVPEPSDFGIDLDSLRSFHTKQPKKQSRLSEARTALNLKTISGLHSNPLRKLAKAPVGPPPVEPLPALPSNGRHPSQSDLSSQYGQYSYQYLGFAAYLENSTIWKGVDSFKYSRESKNVVAHRDDHRSPRTVGQVDCFLCQGGHHDLKRSWLIL